jgi:hypothetical protein
MGEISPVSGPSESNGKSVNPRERDRVDMGGGL